VHETFEVGQLSSFVVESVVIVTIETIVDVAVLAGKL
jgi:hypothetical protein